MAKQINQYSKTRTEVTTQDDDLIDFDSTEDLGVTFESAKITVLSFVNYIRSKITTFYTGNGTVGASRVVTLTDTLAFEDGEVTVKGASLGNSLVLERSVGSAWFTADDNAILTLANPTNARENLILGTGVARAGIEFNSGYAVSSKIYDRNDGDHNDGLTFQSRNNIFEFIGNTGVAGNAEIMVGNLTRVKNISAANINAPIVIQGASNPNDVNDGVRFQTASSLNTYEDRLQIESNSLTPKAYFTNISGLGVGTTTPDSSSLLDVDSTTQGFLPPRMTTTQKNAISTPATGLMVFDTTLAKLAVYTGAGWEAVTSA